MRQALTSFVACFLAVSLWADIRFEPGGKLFLGTSGKITVASVSATVSGGSETGWLNATMTSLIAPSPNVVSDDGSTADAWKWFDHDLGTYADLPWSQAVTYDFGSGITRICNKLKIKNVSGYGINSYTLAGSNNGSSWTDLDTDTPANDETVQEFTVVNTTGYRYYRLTYSGWDFGFTKTSCYEVQIWNE